MLVKLNLGCEVSFVGLEVKDLKSGSRAFRISFTLVELKVGSLSASCLPTGAEVERGFILQ